MAPFNGDTHWPSVCNVPFLSCLYPPVRHLFLFVLSLSLLIPTSPSYFPSHSRLLPSEFSWGLYHHLVTVLFTIFVGYGVFGAFESAGPLVKDPTRPCRCCGSWCDARTELISLPTQSLVICFHACSTTNMKRMYF